MRSFGDFGLANGKGVNDGKKYLKDGDKEKMERSKRWKEVRDGKK
jgi:hypothetical protein